MQIHREGFRILSLSAGILFALLALVLWLVPVLLPASLVVGLVLFLLVLQFFRHPKRLIPQPDDKLVYSPADGKVVVIEEVEEPEYFKDRRLQVSVFMSPLNVHVNRNPIGGIVRYNVYHPGKYLVAWHPKASTENERTTVVIDNGKSQLLMRQIAGAMAKRIRNYLKEGNRVVQGEEMGFITFGSRVDIFLPLNAKVEVAIGQKVKGNLTLLARLED